MKSHSKQRYVSHWIREVRGGASLLAILLLVGILTMTAIGAAVVAFSQLEMGFSSQQGSVVILSAESCAEEAILRLTRDLSYTGGTLILNQVTCTISVTGSGPYTIDVAAVANSFTRNIQVVLDLSGGVDVVSWQEID